MSKDTFTVKDQIVTVEHNLRDRTVTIAGLYGTQVVPDDNPVEIGLIVMEVMTGEKICPPVAYRAAKAQSDLDGHICEEKD